MNYCKKKKKKHYNLEYTPIKKKLRRRLKMQIKTKYSFANLLNPYKTPNGTSQTYKTLKIWNSFI